MRDLVHHCRSQITFAGGARCLVRIHQFLGDGQNHVVDARVHEILEENFLGPFLLVDAWIVGQIIGHSLVSMAQVAGAKWRIHHFHRRGLAAFRWPVSSIKGKSILNVRHIFLEHRQLLAFCLIAHQNGHSIASLNAQHIVGVRLVWRQDDVNFRIFQVHPGKIALVIIIAEQGVGAQAQKVGKVLVVAECGRVSQILGCRLQKLPISDVIGNADQLIAVTAHDSVVAVDLVFLIGMLFYVIFDLLASESAGIKAAIGRHGLAAD